MRLPWNSSVRRRSKSTRRGPSSDSPAGCSMEPPPKMPQAAGNQTKSRRFVPADCRPYGKSGLESAIRAASGEQIVTIERLVAEAASMRVAEVPVLTALDNAGGVYDAVLPS